MGISNDIRPKIKRKIVSEPEPIVEPVKDEPKLEEGEEEVFVRHHEAPAFEHFHNQSKTEEEVDDFFAGSYHKEANEEEPREFKKRRVSGRSLKIIIIVLTILLAIILIKQNIKAIYEYIGLGELLGEEKTSDTSANPYESLSTDYTTKTSPAETTPSAGTGNTAAESSVAASSTAPAVSTTSLDKTLIKVSILNGNGIKGSAAGVKTALETAGYTISNLSNAKVFTYTNTKIYHKTGKSDYAKDIKKTLSDRTVEIEESNSIAGSYDLVIVVGAK